MPASCGWFITGTDTGIGKTLVTAGLMEAFARLDLAVAGMKPVASGCEWIEGRWQNEDARMLRARCTRAVPYPWINPYALEPPIAPSIALTRAGVSLDADVLLSARAHLMEGADVLLVEGVGGCRVPLDDKLDVAGLAALLGLPVLLVVGLRLGCINHALLSAHAVGDALTGWFANRVDPDYDTEAETVDLLTRRLGQPPLAILPHLQAPERSLGALGPALEPAARRLHSQVVRPRPTAG